ncbi:MAG TPA: right-handed parallel beta-helix repeat-containing protein [Pirellulaceae bacterium]|jgi:hypothetical protein|nr:right-handed parallel beta-helix repeat-containing protein [Pirellulaceae bacterium]
MSARSIVALAALTFALYANRAGAETYYVAPNGDDAAAGTLEAPFATVARAQEAMKPGDTTLLRGGTYRMSESHIARKDRLRAHVIELNKSGEENARINYWAYPGETPVFDFSDVKPPRRRVHAFSVSGSWIHLKGIEVIGVQVTIEAHTQSIGFANDGSHNLFERLSIHDGHAIGIYSVGGSDNLFLNCDAYRNYDPVSEGGRGGNVDGFGCHPPRGASGNVFRGCRAWFNSDDGFDCINAHEAVTFEYCWAFWNGYSPEFRPLADGNGFKAGGYGSLAAERLPDPVPRHVVKFCVAVRNKNSGFYANHHVGGCDWIHNVAYRNGANFNLLSRLSDNETDVPGYDHFLRNNLSFRSRRHITNVDEPKSDLVHNSFTGSFDVSESDFLSLNEDLLTAPRTSEGALPEMDFLRLTPESDLIDGGVDLGLPFKGAAPDLGAFETQP